MSLKKSVRNINTRESLKAFFAIIFLLLYVAGNAPVEIIHQFIHANDAHVSHSADQEKDPCHNTIYHVGKKDNCHHDTHLVKLAKCSLCDLIIHSDHVAIVNQSSESVQSYFLINEHVLPGLPHHIALQLPSRAPPVLFTA
jgi:hypothetical protein